MRKRAFRIALGTFGVVSFILCLVIAALWLWSTSELDQVRTANPYHQTTLISVNGEVCVETVSTLMPEFDPGTTLAHALPTQYGPRKLNWQVAGIGAGEQTVPTLEGPIRYETFMIPLWIIFVLLAIPPVLIWEARKPASDQNAAPAQPAF